MIKVLSSSQIRKADAYTIASERIDSIELMERASKAFVDEFLNRRSEKSPVSIFCGTGNNGGDGLAIARLLKQKRWVVSVYIVGSIEKGSEDFKKNLIRTDSYRLIASESDFPMIDVGSIVIDALLGSGLTRPLAGLHAELVEYLNEREVYRLAVDIASGLFSDKPMDKEDVAFKPHLTISFQVPKLPFFFPQSYLFVGDWSVVDIGLNEDFLRNLKSKYALTQADDLQSLFPTRERFTHKNEVGSLMIVAGSEGKIGAAVLASKAAFKAGVGLVNVHVPLCGRDVLQVAIPEAMVSVDLGEKRIQQFPSAKAIYAIGPGLGTASETLNAFGAFLERQTKPLVLDADAINMLSMDRSLLSKLPAESVLTPHPGEFKRLVGAWSNDFEKLQKLVNFCKEYQVNVVLKGAYSAVCNSGGAIYFNPTGNPSMATAGSGDVLTGLVGALLAQGLAPFDALRLGVYLHGAAGDHAFQVAVGPFIQASDIIACLPNAIHKLISESL